MSVYLGNQKVSITRNVGEGGLDPETMAELNDAVRWRTNTFDTSTIPQMISRLKENYFINRVYNTFSDFHTTPWVRPQEWPDLDSLNLTMSGNDFIYMTYDNTKGRAAIALHIEKVTNGTNIEVTMGHISNGEYIVDETISGTNSNYVRWFTNLDDDYPVVRVTGDIKYCYCYNVSIDGATQYYRHQPILERIAYVPHLAAFCTSYSSNAWGQFTTQHEKIANGDGTALTSLYYAWAYCRDLEVLDISGLKTQNVTSMNSAFRQLLRIKELDLRHLEVSKCKNFGSVFDSSRALRTIDVRGWNTGAATDMGSMFSACYSLQEIKGIEDFNTSLVTSLTSTFNGCWSLRELDLTTWDTEKVTTLNSTFNNCRSLLKLDLSTWNVNKVTNLSSTFASCYNLKELNLTNWTTGIITNVYSLFSGCHSLANLDVSWLHLTASCISMAYLFSSCWSIKELNIPSDWVLTGLSNSNNNGHSVFCNCYSLEKITGIANWSYQMANSLTNMFQNCYSLSSVDVSNWKINTITNLATIFQNCYSLTELDLTKWNPESCTTFNSMFSSCSSLTTVGNISSWDTSNCTNMAGMFRYCSSLKTFPPIQNWDFSLVTTIGSIFSECFALEEVTWKNVNLPLCTNIEQLFRYDYALKKADLSGWTIPAVTNTSYYHTLGDCHSLQEVIGFPIPSTYLNIGFQNCENLSYESLMLIINALPTVTSTHTLRIPAMTLNLLTPNEKAIATGKGWTLANS